MKKMLASGLLMAALAGGFGPVYAQSIGSMAKKAGDTTKEAGKATADAAKDVGKTGAKETKKRADKAKKTVTGNAHATCADATVQEAKTDAAAAAACSSHGGVAKR